MKHVVLDTDTYNEVDDQFALAYLLGNEGKVQTQALYAAPFHNERSSSPEDGMERSYREILTILPLLGREDLVPRTYRGATAYLPNETTPVPSDAARDLAARAMHYTSEERLAVVAIGAITNIASAILLNPEITSRIEVIWLGGHALHHHTNNEFNMRQDIAAARVVISSGVPFTLVPCRGGVAEGFSLSLVEMDHHLKGKNPLCDYLLKTVHEQVDPYTDNPCVSRIIWDVTAVGCLLGGARFMEMREEAAPMPSYRGVWEDARLAHKIRYIFHIHRDSLARHLIETLTTKF